MRWMLLGAGCVSINITITLKHRMHARCSGSGRRSSLMTSSTHTHSRRCNVRMKVMTPRIRTHIYYRKRSNSYVVVEHALANISSAHLIETQTPSHTCIINVDVDRDCMHNATTDSTWPDGVRRCDWLHNDEKVFRKTKLEIQSNCGTNLDSHERNYPIFALHYLSSLRSMYKYLIISTIWMWIS